MSSLEEEPRPTASDLMAMPEEEFRSFVKGKGLKTRPLSETEFQKQVVELATILGWQWVHFRPAQTSKGWRTPVSGTLGKGGPAPVKLLRVPRVAAILDVSVSHVYAMCQEGTLPSVRLGRSLRVPEDALEEWVGSQTRVGVPRSLPASRRSMGRTGGAPTRKRRTPATEDGQQPGQDGGSAQAEGAVIKYLEVAPADRHDGRRLVNSVAA